MEAKKCYKRNLVENKSRLTFQIYLVINIPNWKLSLVSEILTISGEEQPVHRWQLVPFTKLRPAQGTLGFAEALHVWLSEREPPRTQSYGLFTS